MLVKKAKLYSLLNKADNLIKQRKFDEAIDYCDKALEIYQNDVYALDSKGLALSGQKRYDEAIVNFDKILEIDQNDIRALNSKGLALSGQKRYDEAIVNFDKILEIDQNDVYALVNKAEAQIELNQLDEAKKICDSLKVRTDLEEQAYSELMNLYSKLKDFSSVKQIFEKSSKSVQLYETYTKILEINAESNLEEKQIMQKDLDKILQDTRQLQQMIEFHQQTIQWQRELIERAIPGIKKSIIEDGEKTRIHNTYEAEKTRNLIINLFKSLNDDISKIKQNGKKTLAGIHDLDQKMDKLSEISDKIYEEAKKASENLIEKDPKKFNEKKKELLERFDVKYEVN